MAGFLKLEVDEGELTRLFDDLSKSAQRANINALNVVGALGNKAIKKNILRNYNIKNKSLTQGKLVKPRRADIRKRRPVYELFVKGVKRGLLLYSARQVARGVRFTTEKSERFIRSAFISTLKKGSSNLFVFLRDPKKGTYRAGRGKGKSRTKRRVLFGPSVAAMYDSQNSRDALNKTIDKNYQKVLDEKFNDQFEKRR